LAAGLAAAVWAVERAAAAKVAAKAAAGREAATEVGGSEAVTAEAEMAEEGTVAAAKVA
jgi:hypothetical protein